MIAALSRDIPTISRMRGEIRRLTRQVSTRFALTCGHHSRAIESGASFLRAVLADGRSSGLFTGGRCLTRGIARMEH